MDLRYDIVDETDLLNTVDQIENYLQTFDHPVDQEAKNIDKQNKNLSQ